MMQRFIRDRRAATSIEYAMLAALIALVLVGVLGAIGDSLGGWVQDALAGFALQGL